MFSRVIYREQLKIEVMNRSSKLKIIAIVAAIVAVCGQADAHRPHKHHIYRPAQHIYTNMWRGSLCDICLYHNLLDELIS